MEDIDDGDESDMESERQEAEQWLKFAKVFRLANSSEVKSLMATSLKVHSVTLACKGCCAMRDADAIKLLLFLDSPSTYTLLYSFAPPVLLVLMPIP